MLSVYKKLAAFFDCGEANTLYQTGAAIHFQANGTDIYWEGKSGMSVYRWPDADRLNIRQVTLDREIGEIEGDLKDHVLTDLSFSKTDGDYLILYRCVCTGETVEIPGSVSFPGCPGDGMQVAFVTGEAFEGCETLRQITFGEGIEGIEYWLRDCPALETVLLPDSFYRYEMLGVSGCPAFRGFAVRKTNPAVYMENGCLILAKNVRIMSKALGEIREYSGCRLACGPYGVKECTVPDGVEIIEAGAFADRTVLEKVTVPDSVLTIGDEAFSCCPDLREVYLPFGMHTIGEKAFYGCEKLETLRMPYELEHIGMGAFWDCGALEEPSIPEQAELFSNDYDGSLLFGPDPELNRW